MTANPPNDPAASIRARLLNYARRQRDDFQRVLTRYAAERLLYRLSRTNAVEDFVLKGAMLLCTWPGQVFRSTGDLDLLGRGDPDPSAVAGPFTRFCRLRIAEDGIVFDPSTLMVEPLLGAHHRGALRLHLKGELARAIIAVQVDIGFGDIVCPRPSLRPFPNLLPDLPAAIILMYPPETVVAEKFEAIVRLGAANSRMKDFYDIWVATRTFSFELETLTKAIGGTLRCRATPIPRETPAGLVNTFAAIAAKSGLWSGFLRRTRPAFSPPAFEELQRNLRDFFRPVVTGLTKPEAASLRWNPDDRRWC